MREAYYEQEGTVLAVRLEVGEMLDMKILALLQGGLPGAARCRLEMRGEFRWLLFNTAGYHSILQYQQKGWNKDAFLRTAFGIAYEYRELAEKGVPAFMVSTSPAHVLVSPEGAVLLICIPLESQSGEGVGAILKSMVYQFPFVQNEDDSYIGIMIRELFTQPRITPELCIRCLQQLDPAVCRQENRHASAKGGTVLVADAGDYALQEEARRQAEEKARRQAEEEARRQAEQEARRQAEQEARRQAEEEARRQAEEEARRQAEEEARRQAEEEARHKAEAVYYLRRNKTGTMYRLDQDVCQIGRWENADFDLAGNPSISRRHAVLTRRDGKWYLRDVGSLNRTYVNGKQLEFETEVEIHPGDRLRFADEQVLFIQQ